MAHYLHVERLEGDNKYECSQCCKKVDATKGFKLIKLPRILCFNLNRFAFDYKTLSRVKINEKVTFPLLMNMNPFLRDYSNEEIEKLIEDNPVAKVRPSDLKIGKFSHLDDENAKDKEEIKNETSERYQKFMNNELENLEDQGMLQVEGQTALERHKKMQGEEKKHKEYLKKMKKGINTRKGRFNPKNLNSNFFANNKKAPNEAKGCLMEFAVEDSTFVTGKPKNTSSLPGESDKLMEERKKQKIENEKKQAELDKNNENLEQNNKNEIIKEEDIKGKISYFNSYR